MTCSKCGQTKPVAAFRREWRATWDSWCNECHSLEAKERRLLALGQWFRRKGWTETCPAGLHPVFYGSSSLQVGGNGGMYRVCRRCNAEHAKARRDRLRCQSEPAHAGQFATTPRNGGA